MKRNIIAAALATLITSVNALGVTPKLVKNADMAKCQHWVDSVYNSLTLKQRVAQLVFPKMVPTYGEKTRAALRRLVETNNVGGLLFTEGNIDQYVEMTNYTQSIAQTPVLMTFDGEWGLSMRISDTPRFPHNMGLGAIRNEKLIYEYGAEMARECRAMGVHVNCAPDADVNSNPANPVIGYRSFGEDPARVARMVNAYSHGLEDGNVQSVAKHFPGHGDTSADSHKALPVVNRSMADLKKVELVPFKSYIDEGLSGIMVGHISIPAIDKSGTPTSLSSKCYKLLRNDMKFEGLVYTDALGMKGASSIKGKNPTIEALKAGADVLLCPPNPVDDINAIVTAVKSKKISEKVIEDRCKRILTYKYLLGLNTPKTVGAKSMSTVLNSPRAEVVNRHLSAAIQTVLINQDNTLPIKDVSSKSIAVVNIGVEDGAAFTKLARRYSDVDVYNTANGEISSKTLAQIKKHKTVIAAVYNDKASSQTALSKLAGHDNLIATFFINPYKMKKFSASIAKVKALLLSYDDTPYIREYAAQALFGGIDVDGYLPVNLEGIAKIGTGFKLRKNRLGYSSPMSEDMNPQLTDRIDSLVNKAMNDGAFPGCQVLVAKDGNVVLDRAYGLLTANGDSVSEFTLYDLASVSKAIGTLPGVMKAVDNKLIDINEKASTYIPGLRDGAKQDITVKELLFHESGMPASLNMFNTMVDTASYTAPLITRKSDAVHTIKIQENAYGHKGGRLRTDITSTTKKPGFEIEAARGIMVGRETYDTIMRRIYEIPLRRDKSYNYSCLNFCLLMDAEQRVTGIDHQTWCSTNFWEPLGAWSLCYRPTGRFDLKDIAPTEKDTYLRRQTVHGYVHDETAAFSGGVQGNAGLFGDANDLAKMCQMWLNGGTYGGERLLSEKTIKLFTTTKSPTCRRGLGFDKPDTENLKNSPTCDEASASVYGHLGFTGTVFWVDPDKNLIFVFLTNRVNPSRDNKAFSQSSIRPALFSEVYKSLDK
jgi:beta-glucosidase-like glycosyl hydrolase/CubicO group peptidase (beta-lactamase class C family)